MNKFDSQYSISSDELILNIENIGDAINYQKRLIFNTISKKLVDKKLIAMKNVFFFKKPYVINTEQDVLDLASKIGLNKHINNTFSDDYNFIFEFLKIVNYNETTKTIKLGFNDASRIMRIKERVHNTNIDNMIYYIERRCEFVVK